MIKKFPRSVVLGQNRAQWSSGMCWSSSLPFLSQLSSVAFKSEPVLSAVGSLGCCFGVMFRLLSLSSLPNMVLGFHLTVWESVFRMGRWCRQLAGVDSVILFSYHTLEAVDLSWPVQPASGNVCMLQEHAADRRSTTKCPSQADRSASPGKMSKITAMARTSTKCCSTLSMVSLSSNQTSTEFFGVQFECLESEWWPFYESLDKDSLRDCAWRSVTHSNKLPMVSTELRPCRGLVWALAACKSVLKEKQSPQRHLATLNYHSCTTNAET